MEVISGFLSEQPAQQGLVQFLVAMGLATVFSLLLSEAYIRFGRAVTSRRLLAGNFLLVTLTTLLIITVVKSSIALSLGLVGALSIVRFRAAIKDPEELSFLFLAIAAGLGFGANQILLTVIAVSFILIALIIRHLISGRKSRPNLYVTIRSKGEETVPIEKLAAALADHCSALNMTHLDEQPEALEVSFEAEFPSLEALVKGKEQLKALDQKLHITFVDQNGLN